MGLRNLLPHYLNRLGMEVSWAGKIGVILHVLNLIVLLVTVVFRASPSSQQWAYATSVLVLIAGAALAAALDRARRTPSPVASEPQGLPPRSSTGIARALRTIHFAAAGAFFLAMTGSPSLINHSGLTIALAFVAAILTSSIISRWIRSTELRFEGFDFADAHTHAPLGRARPLRRQSARPAPPGAGVPCGKIAHAADATTASIPPRRCCSSRPSSATPATSTRSRSCASIAKTASR